ncbi:hypothetical protein [Pseudomonas helleri]|uniref:hypothetical protein n=1 Tax=Pseudomonas helleri TaxID=1608996 RepID=UPI003FD69CF9
MNETESKIHAAHEKHAWTLAFMVFGALAVLVYWLDGWLHAQRGSWAEFAYFVLYVVSFFAVFGLGYVKDWFLYRLIHVNRAQSK